VRENIGNIAKEGLGPKAEGQAAFTDMKIDIYVSDDALVTAGSAAPPSSWTDGAFRAGIHRPRQPAQAADRRSHKAILGSIERFLGTSSTMTHPVWLARNRSRFIASLKITQAFAGGRAKLRALGLRVTAGWQ